MVAAGALGAAVGYGLYDIAVVLALTTFLTLRWSQPLKKAAQIEAIRPGTLGDDRSL